MKNFISFFLFLIITSVRAQSLYIKSEGSVEGMPFLPANWAKSKSEVWSKEGKYKSVISSMNQTQTQYNNGESITILNSSDPRCIHFSKEELKTDSVINNTFISDISVQKTNEKKVILKNPCEKTIIRYSVANKESKTINMHCEMSIWACNSLQFSQSLTQPLEYTKRNALTAAIQSVEGVILSTETYIKESGMRTVSTVIEISNKNISDSEFEPGEKECRKAMGLKEYNAYLVKENNKPTGWH